MSSKHADAYLFSDRQVRVDTSKVRLELNSDVEAFLKAGGKVEKLKSGASATPGKGYNGSVAPPARKKKAENAAT